jgi:ferric-dicitrate binding protein FerR (iron transport regulator)
LHVTGYFRAGDIDTLLELIDSNERVSVRRINPGLVHITASRN